MPAQNNGTSIMVDELEDGGSGGVDNRNNRKANGHDNPAFEKEIDAAETVSNSSRLKQTNGEMQNKDHVEMLPLNPSPSSVNTPTLSNGTSTANNNHNNNNGNNNGKGKGKGKTTTTTKSASNDKVALDNMYSEYFRPVNTRRKLLRGEKLYVTRDQRAHNRSWKWIFFWGGVFTILAAALLIGILAASGIIMSHSKPWFGTSNSLVASNDSYWNHHLNESMLTANESSMKDISSTERTTTEMTTISADLNHAVRDFDNSLDDDEKRKDEKTSTEFQPSSIPDDPIVHWLTRFDTTIVNHHSTDRSANDNTTVDRGRSLDEEVTIVSVIHHDDTTLFPTLIPDGIQAIDEDFLNDTMVVETTTSDENEILNISKSTTFKEVVTDNFTAPLQPHSLNATIDDDLRIIDHNETAIDRNATELQYTVTQSIHDVLNLSTESVSRNSSDDFGANDTVNNTTSLHNHHNFSVVSTSLNETLHDSNSTLLEGRQSDDNMTLPAEVAGIRDTFLNDTNVNATTMSANESFQMTTPKEENVTLPETNSTSIETSTSNLESNKDNDNLSDSEIHLESTVMPLNETSNFTSISSTNDSSKWDANTTEQSFPVFKNSSDSLNVSHPIQVNITELKGNITERLLELATTMILNSTNEDETTTFVTSWNETSDYTEAF